MKPAPFDHLTPATPAAVIDALAGETSKIIAGGQSLGPMLNLRLARPERIVGLTALPGLRDIRQEAGRLVIGAGVTHARIEDNDTPLPLPLMLRHVARGIAYRAVRNKGTIGGSLAHADPAADWITTLTALAATVHVTGPQGTAREVPMSDFMRGAYRTALGAQDILTAVSIDAQMGDALWGYDKICRKIGEFADAIGAFVVHPASGHAKLIAGATGARPLILTDLAASIARSAQHPGDPALLAALRAQLPGADRVKLHLLTTALSRAIAKVIPA